MNRRRFLSAAVAGMLVCLGHGVRTAVAGQPSGPQPSAEQRERRLELTNLHTGEVASVTFRNAGDLGPHESARLQHLLRDYRTGESHLMDPELYVLLSDLARQTGCEARFEIISGYRSPATNARLHASGHAVAEHSLHMEGRALDVRLKACSLEQLHEVALAAKRGGVGYYPRSNFVHVDTGRVRSWTE